MNPYFKSDLAEFNTELSGSQKAKIGKKQTKPFKIN